MQTVDLPIDSIIPAQWNPNEMDPDMLIHLRRSIQRFDLVVPLVVRNVGDGRYETIGGAQRLSILRELGMNTAPCVLVQANDAEARFLPFIVTCTTIRSINVREVLNHGNPLG